MKITIYYKAGAEKRKESFLSKTLIDNISDYGFCVGGKPYHVNKEYVRKIKVKIW